MQTEEYLLDGMKILQDSDEYRFTSDSVLLARFLKAKREERVADFCSGSGVVGLHFYGENSGVEHVTLFEMQSRLAKMSAKSVALNGLQEYFTVENVRLQEIPAHYTEAFSLILCNPPYERGGPDNADYRKAVCRKEITVNLEEIARAAAFALKFGGRIALTNRADRLAEVCYVFHSAGIEIKRVQFAAGREGTKPYLLLCEGVKGGRPGTELLPLLVNAGAPSKSF